MGKKFWLLFLIIAIAGLTIHLVVWSIPPRDLRSEDIFFIWLEGKRIILGDNPYARVLASNLRVNDKYATYFPLAYLFSALTQKLGLTEYRQWLLVWRPLSYLFHIGIAALILRAFQQRRAWILGLAAALIMLLNRWSLYVIKVHHVEFAAIFFLLLSLLLLRKTDKLALLAYSLSLGIKQIAIFLLPLYFIHIFRQAAPDKRRQDIGVGLLIILSIPIITSMPFLIWNAEGFVKSILFSATRLAESHIPGAPSLDAYAADSYPWLVGLRAKAPMLVLMGLTYLSFLKEKVSIMVASSITMIIFLYFHSVLFLQYFVWPLSLILLTLPEAVDQRSFTDQTRQK